MKSLVRLPEPQIITNRGGDWLQALLLSGKNRPDPSKYGNPSVRLQLDTMSFHKCFYCESKLKGMPKEVDHQIEVSIDINQSYIWNNLYLSCDNCNNKIPHDIIPINEALDPCINTDDEISQNLTFIDEVITAKDGSIQGLKTIQKYRLDTDLLDKRRVDQLKNFYKLLESIRRNQIRDGGRPLNANEIESLNHFKQADQPYSLMFKVILSTTEI